MYCLQVQMFMAVCNVTEMYFAVWTNVSSEIVEIKFYVDMWFSDISLQVFKIFEMYIAVDILTERAKRGLPLLQQQIDNTDDEQPGGVTAAAVS